MSRDFRVPTNFDIDAVAALRAAAVNAQTHLNTPTDGSNPNYRGELGRVDEFWRNDVFGIPELNQT